MHHTPTVIRRRLPLLVLALTATWLGAYVLASAQAPTKKALTVDDYTRWRSITGQEISGDGAWASYDLQLTNTAAADAKPVLHLVKLGTNEDVLVPDGTGGAFSADSQWIAYQVNPAGGRGGRGARGGGGAAPAAPPQDSPNTAAPGGQAARGRGTHTGVPPRVSVRTLAPGAVQAWQDAQSFTFSPPSTHLLWRPRPAGAEGGR